MSRRSRSCPSLTRLPARAELPHCAYCLVKMDNVVNESRFSHLKKGLMMCAEVIYGPGPVADGVFTGCSRCTWPRSAGFPTAAGSSYPPVSVSRLPVRRWETVCSPPTMCLVPIQHKRSTTIQHKKLISIIPIHLLVRNHTNKITRFTSSKA